MTESAVNDNVTITNQHTITVSDSNEDTDNQSEDETATDMGVVQVPAAIKLPLDKDDDDFRPEKRRKIQESSDSTEVDEGQVCSICLEPWSNSGVHRIASLKCGHLFGLSCVDKWLKGSGGKCPQCNAKAKKGDIRLIYAKAISVVDTTERDQALKELGEEKSKTLNLQKEEAQAVLQCQLAQSECSKLQKRIAELEQKIANIKEGEASSEADLMAKPVVDSNGTYVHLKNIEIASQGGARVVAYDSLLGMLVVSKPSSNQLFPGYGLVKISALELRVSEYIAVHKATLRDASFSSDSRGIVLTVGMDKLAKLTSLQSNSTVQSYEAPGPIWSCCWNQIDANYFYCGVQNGSVMLFDIRNTSSSVTCMKQEHSMCPITSLCHISHSRASNFGCEGILAGTLEGAVFWEKKSEKFVPHGLALLDGSCTSMTFEPLTRHCLASFRPSKRHSHCRHVMYQLNSAITETGDSVVSCRICQQFTGGQKCKLLSRSSLFVKPNGGHCGTLLTAYGDEASHSVQLWDTSTLAKFQQLDTQPNPVLDIKPFNFNDVDYLTVLTEKHLKIYNWAPR